MAQWDDDGRKDLLLGTAEGRLLLLFNEGSNNEPVFNAGVFLQVGPPGGKTDIDVVSRSAPCIVDWNNDGRRDLLVGAGDGQLRLFLNEGEDFAPDYRETVILPDAYGSLVVPFGSSSPVVADWDGDGRKDIISGHTAGHLIFYKNVGSDMAPEFDRGYEVESVSVIFDLVGIGRTRPCLCDWTGDGRLDLLVGSMYSKLHLIEGEEIIPDALPDFMAAASLDAPWPQPARGSARLSFSLAGPAELDLSVFDMRGRRVARLAAGPFGSGPQERRWDGRDERGREMPAGLYIVRLEVAGQVLTRKLLLLR